MNTDYLSELGSAEAPGSRTIRRTPLGRFIDITRLSLTNLSTPIERADRLRQLIPGAPHIYIKRDDLNGYFGGGNKVRKLEYVMADALGKAPTTVRTAWYIAFYYDLYTHTVRSTAGA